MVVVVVGVVVGSLGVVVEVAVVTVVVGVGAGEEGDERRVITPWHAANSYSVPSR